MKQGRSAKTENCHCFAPTEQQLEHFSAKKCFGQDNPSQLLLDFAALAESDKTKHCGLDVLLEAGHESWQRQQAFWRTQITELSVAGRTSIISSCKGFNMFKCELPNLNSNFKTQKHRVTPIGVLCLTVNANQLAVNYRKPLVWWVSEKTYRRIFGAAGKRHPTFLTTRVWISAVEVDVQIPVIGSKSSTTLPLQG